MNQQERDERDRKPLLSAARCGDIISIQTWLGEAGEESRGLINEISRVATENGYEKIAHICTPKLSRENGVVLGDVYGRGAGAYYASYALEDTEFTVACNGARSGELAVAMIDDTPTVRWIAAEYGWENIAFANREEYHYQIPKLKNITENIARINGKPEHYETQHTIHDDQVFREPESDKFVLGHREFNPRILRCAARNGHKQIVERFRPCKSNLGCRDRVERAVIHAIHDAAREGYAEIVDILKTFVSDAFDFNAALWEAATNGHVTIVDRCLSLGATCIDTALLSASKNGTKNVSMY